MCMRQVANSDRQTRFGAEDHRTPTQRETNGFLEDCDLAASRIEWLTAGDARDAIVRFGYATGDRKF